MIFVSVFLWKKLLKIIDGKSNLFLPIGHFGVLHIWVSQDDPAQAKPPLDGGGLLQSLALPWMASPQEVLHADHADQAPQLPSSYIKKIVATKC